MPEKSPAVFTPSVKSKEIELLSRFVKTMRKQGFVIVDDLDSNTSRERMHKHLSSLFPDWPHYALSDLTDDLLRNVTIEKRPKTAKLPVTKEEYSAIEASIDNLEDMTGGGSLSEEHLRQIKVLKKLLKRMKAL